MIQTLATASFAIHAALAAPFSDANEKLLAAARAADVKAVKAAIDAGADVNATTEYGATPLFFAADRGNVEVVGLLLDRGAEVNATDSFYGATPLAWASMSGHAQVVRVLLKAGATGAGDTLRSAAAGGDLEMVRAVLDSGKVEPEMLSGAYAGAVAAGHTELAELIKAAGIKPTAVPSFEVPAETLAKYEGTYENNEIGMELTISAGENKLIGAVPGQPPITYAPSNETKFESVEFPGIALVFEVKDGKVPGLTVEQGGRSFAFPRKKVKQPGGKDAAAVNDDPAGAADASIESTAREESPAVVGKPQNWPSFRGPGASGIADGQAAPTTWDVTTSKNVRWKTPIPGLGHASPIVWGDRVFVSTAISGDPESLFRPGLYGDVDSVDDSTTHTWKLHALKLRTGEVVWDRVAYRGIPKVKRHMKASHANCTPVTDGRHVVVSFASEGMYCYDFEGKLLWQQDLGLLDSGWFFDPDYQWGFSSSPIIYRDLVIVQVDIQTNSFIAAYDVNTGKQTWRTPRDEIPSWGTPTIYDGANHAELVTNSSKHIYGYDPLTGKELWRLAGNSEVTVGTPVVGDDLIYFTGGYRPIQPIYAVRAGATGDITPADIEKGNEHIAWAKSKRGTYMPTPIVYRGHF
ncbi:MAG: ankyrin repeat domain-containing protein, partial [Phycisphaerae bacterium]